MNTTTPSPSFQTDTLPRRGWGATARRVVKYMLNRAIVLGLMLAAGIYLAVIVANFGGFVDDMYRADIDEILMFTPPPDGLTPEEVEQYAQEMRASLEKAFGLDQPFMIRSARWAWNAARLDWGNTYRFKTLDKQDDDVQKIVAERLGVTLLVFGSAALLMFVFSLPLAFWLARHFDSRIDRVMINLSVFSSIPNWMIGAVLTAIFAYQLHILPATGFMDTVAYDHTFLTALGILRHMVLPVGAIFLGLFFQAVTTWRALFLVQGSEDYVEMAHAKGLPTGVINQKYLLRPTLPYIITNFAMLVVGVWQTSMALEVWFGWPGIGQLMFMAIGRGNIDRSVILAIIVTFAYLLAATVFILELVYALLDPRVRLGSAEQTLKSSRLRGRFTLPWRKASPPQRGIRPPGSADALRGAQKAAPRVGAASRGGLRRWGAGVRQTLQEIGAHPSAIFGIGIVLIMGCVSIYTVTRLPYDMAVKTWRQDVERWYRNPVNARPTWINLLRVDKLPETIIQNSQEENFPREVTPGKSVGDVITLTYGIEYPYSELPQDMTVYFSALYKSKKPLVTLTWRTPDGREIDLGRFSIVKSYTYYLSGDKKLIKRFGQNDGILLALFTDPQTGDVIPGRYELQVQASTFEAGNEVNAEVILFGKVFGWAGTDNLRRDLSVGLLWGAPVALTFGLLGTFFTVLATAILAAVSSWFGGWVDDLIQRLTDISMLLPTLPVAMTVFYLYSKTIWAILGTIVVLNIFGSSLKSFRAAFLQVKEAPYIEAARAYGASDWRIVARYMAPRLLPILVPQFIVQVPAFIFLETTLAFLGVSDIYLPTWGKIIFEAVDSGALNGNAYWILQPIALLLSTGLAFSIVGLTIDRLFNPKLRIR